MYRVEVKRTDNANKFREAALSFQKNGYYCSHPRGTTAYKKFWDEESRRCLDGFTSDDGEWISGYFYFYLNYSPIIKVESVEGSKRGKRIRNFPDFWDYDRAFFDSVEEAEKEAKHLTFLKPRGVGCSFKAGSMLARNYFLIRESTSLAVTEETESLTKDGVLTKAWDVVDFVNEHTAWTKKSQKINTKLHKRASIVLNNGTTELEVGYKSEIIGFSVKNNPDKGRGKRFKLCFVDEIGLVTSPIHLFSVMRHGAEEDGTAYGLIILAGTGGCVCAGTKVWTSDGDLVNIEDLQMSQGIIGFNKGFSKETISYYQEPIAKQCYRITTNTKRVLDCSEDHPIYTAVKKPHLKSSFLFKEIKDLKVGDCIGVIEEVLVFGSKKMFDPRFIGWLIGDGSYGKKQTPTLSNCEEEITEYVEKFYTTRTGNSYLTKTGKTYKELSISKIIPILRDLGIYEQVKLNKRLPLDIHSYCKEDICDLLGGLFDTDGYVALRLNKTRNKPIAEISISQASISLLNEIRLLLQKLGIHGTIRKRMPRENNPKDRNPWYEFIISDQRSLIKFADNIKLFPKEKQKRLNNIKEVYSYIKPSNVNKGFRTEKITNIEYIGIQNVYNLTADVTHTYIANGIITHNTSDADYSEMRRLFYEPDVYNFLEIENVWDEGQYGNSCGFFWPKYYNMRGFMDEHGNSDPMAARKYEEAERQRIIASASDRNQIDRNCAERPFVPEEALLQISQNIFPKKELLNHLNYIRSHEKIRNFKQVGNLLFGEQGIIQWEPDPKPKDITSYRLKKDENQCGQVVVWEHPVDNPPYGLYIMGCLIPGEKVLTDIGLQNVEDVNYSRQLVNKEGELVDIKALLRYNKVDEDIYTLKLSNNYRTTTFTKEHPIYSSAVGFNKNLTIAEDKFKFEFNKIKDIKIGDWIKVPNMYSKVIDYDCQFDNPYFWWFVGLWLGDGWCESDGNKISVAFNKLEEDYVNKFIFVVEKFFKRKVNIRRREGNGIECSFCYNELSTYLTNTFGKYAIGKYIPEFVKYLPGYKKSQLLRGYLNSDGCITKHTKGYYSAEFVSINLEILESIQDICFSLGMISNLSKMRNASVHNFGKKDCVTKPCYHLRLGHHDTLKLRSLLIIHDLDEDAKLDKIDIDNLQKIRNRSKNGCFISDDSKYIYFKIKKLDKSKYTGIVYNFECDTHSFMCRYITTHNCDPYDHDQASTSTSLGSVFVYKRMQTFEEYYDMPVAEYTGRPETVEEFYENVRKLALYYNAKILYENEKKGLYIHFAHKHCEYLLLDQPSIIRDIMQDSKVERGKGIHMNKQIKQYMELKLRDWLNEEYEPGKKNLTKILSEPLLEELIEYNPDGNFDRVISYGLCIMHNLEIFNIQVKDNKKETRKKMLFPDGIFKENTSFDSDSMFDMFNQGPTYTPWR